MIRLKRNLLKNLYFLVLGGLFIYYLHISKYFSRADGVVKKGVAEGETYEGPFPDSQVYPGKIQHRVDWHDYLQEAEDKKKSGPGEQGVPHQLPSGLEEKKQELIDLNGFNALISDHISLDRALADIRHPACKKAVYFERLPTVSIVIPFFEEHWTTLLRTIKSVVNRSPKQLLKEIILVDDGSFLKEKEFLRAPLDEWLKDFYPNGRVVRLKERVGLIVARQEGARVATGDVILVLDSHCEVMNNWLPPLLEPIVENYRTTVCPLIDGINKDSFGYYPQDNGGRGAFDWHFFYKRLPLFPEDNLNLPKPFINPVMNGGLFAISRQFFWELGGYDEGLAIWGGEQYNLSFKIWQCGGRMLDVPCSRVGHVFRGGGKKRPSAKAGDYMSKNYKRVAVAWMDEYAEYLYLRNPHLRNVDPGNLTQELQVRERLKCKPFKWFIENIAPDLVIQYPPVEPPNYANGTIKNVGNPELCLDKGASQVGNIIMYGCHGFQTQVFKFSYMQNIRVDNDQFCWTSTSQLGQAPSMVNCGDGKSSRIKWTYDPDTMLLQDQEHHWCVEAKPLTRTIEMTVCETGNRWQQWNFAYVDKERIKHDFPKFSLT